jgi:hypothetical protein
MKVQGSNHNEFLIFQCSRNIINQAKDCLIILEDLKKDNILSEEYYARLRSKILGSANDKVRDMTAIIQQFSVELNKK